MKALEDVIRDAAEEVRAVSREIPNRRWVAPRRSPRPRFFAALAGAAVVIAAVGIPALLIDAPSSSPPGQSGVEETATTNSPETTADQESPVTTIQVDTTVAQEGSVTTVIEVDTTVTQLEGTQVEGNYLTVRTPGWHIVEATSSDSGRSVLMVFREMTEDGTGDEVALELTTVADGPLRSDFMRVLEYSGVNERREVSVRGVDAILWMSDTGIWALEEFDASKVGEFLVLRSGSNPDILLELAEALEPMSSDEWAEIIATLGG